MLANSKGAPLSFGSHHAAQLAGLRFIRESLKAPKPSASSGKEWQVRDKSSVHMGDCMIAWVVGPNGNDTYRVVAVGKTTPLTHAESMANAIAIALAPRLQDEVVRLRLALQSIADIKNKLVGSDWEEIEEARGIANSALAEQQDKP